MSFSRFGCENSDVYTFFNTDGFYECCGCIIRPHVENWFKTPKELIEHLMVHQSKGHVVPDSCFELCAVSRV